MINVPFSIVLKKIVFPSHSSVALHVNGVAVFNPYDTANIFNRTFAQKFLTQLLLIPSMSAHPMDNSNISVISDLQMSKVNVRQTLLLVKRSISSPDNLPGLFLNKPSTFHTPSGEYSSRCLNTPAFLNIGNKQLSYHSQRERSVLRLLEGLVKNRLENMPRGMDLSTAISTVSSFVTKKSVVF